MRPKTITITTWLMALFNFLGYALLWHLQKPAPVVVALGVAYTILIAFGYVVLWFYWHGKNWARFLVLLTSVLALFNLRDLAPANIAVKVMIIGEALIAVFLLYWLNTSAAKVYFNGTERHALVGADSSLKARPQDHTE